jgi:hypothetical protein
MGSTPWPKQLALIKAVGYNYAMALPILIRNPIPIECPQAFPSQQVVNGRPAEIVWHCYDITRRGFSHRIDLVNFQTKRTLFHKCDKVGFCRERLFMANVQKGGCLCGASRFEIIGEGEFTIQCYCRAASTSQAAGICPNMWSIEMRSG